MTVKGMILKTLLLIPLTIIPMTTWAFPSSNLALVASCRAAWFAVQKEFLGCGLTRKVGRFRGKDSVGGTPTEAVETTALPKKSLMIRGSFEIKKRACKKPALGQNHPQIAHQSRKCVMALERNYATSSTGKRWQKNGGRKMKVARFAQKAGGRGVLCFCPGYFCH